MINLLPPTDKDNLIYARKNTRLLHYCSLAVVVIFGMALLTGIGIMYMNSSKNALAQQAERTKTSLREQNLESVQKQTDEISSNIKLATDVLSRQVLFSKLIKQIGAVMPANTILSDLKFSTNESGITLTAIANNYTSASQVQVNLADPSNKLFKKADIIGINCNSGNDPRYPCTISVRALFGDNKSYLFINPSGDKR